MKDTEKNHRVYVGIGSNIEPIKHIKKCVQSLREEFTNLKLSPIYESSSMGFTGPNFYNLAASFDTTHDYESLKVFLNHVESSNGRSLGEVKFSSRTLDIDILYYDDLIDVDKNIPRGEITKFDFVLRPLYDLQPGHIHPVIMKTHYTMINDMRLQKMIVRQIDASLLE